MNTLELASHGPVIPVIVIHDLADAVPLARALVEGGVKVLEVTLRTPVALRCMEAIAAAVPGAIVGAGTIRSVPMRATRRTPAASLRRQPGYTSEVGRACRDIGLPLLPGVATASEVMQANADGYSFLKFFPATAAGGIPFAQGAASAFPDGSSAPPAASRRRARRSFALPNVKVCGGFVADAGRRGGRQGLGPYHHAGPPDAYPARGLTNRNRRGWHCGRICP